MSTMLTESSASKAHYALRRTLPVWSFEANLCELIEQLPRYGVDEVIVKVDTEEFSHGQPPLEWVRQYQPRLLRIKEAMAEIGVAYSLNPWFTLGHCDRGRDGTVHIPGLQTIVGHDGTECACCACPLSDAWRAHVQKVWTLYAETQPKVIWVEDDIRTFNHKPVEFGCFCPVHMQRFSRCVGQTVTREQLVAALLQPGSPHPWRQPYLDMQAQVMIETVGFLARTVHDIAPQTSMGLMSSGPRQHCLEGRRWNDFATALADGRPLYSRPPMGNYNEDSLRGFYYSHDSIKLTRHCMPAGTIEQAEVESVPFTRYSKSVAFTFLEIALSFAYGNQGVTMNLFDHCGTAMQDEPWYGRMLAERKPFLAALAEVAQRPGVYRGVQLLHHDQASHVKRLGQMARYRDLGEDGYPMMELLESHGIATTYDPEQVIATCGQTLRTFSDEQIRQMLGRGVLLDATAAAVLVERGFGPDIGLTSIDAPVSLHGLGAFGAEEYYNQAFGGRDKCFLTLSVPNLGGEPALSLVSLAPNTQVISSVVDPDARRVYPCMIAYENERGGRVITHLLDLASAYGVAFNHPHRQQQLHAAISWLSRQRPGLLVRGSVYPLALRKDCGRQTLLGLFNLTLDPWPHVEFELEDPRSLEHMEVLTNQGHWVAPGNARVAREGQRQIIRMENPVSYETPLFLLLHWEA